MNIKRIILISLAALIFAGEALANNLKVENVSLYRAPGQPAGTIGVKFDLSWDKSFTAIDNNGSTFFDRAWVFVKYFDAASPVNTAWGHAALISGGTIGNYDAASGTGISADKKGAFCRPGANQVVYWNYGGSGGNGLLGTASFSVKVMAIEMVYVPQGAFYLGSGGTTANESGSFTAGSWWPGTPTIPFKVESESAINIAPGAVGNLWGTSVSGFTTIGPTGTLLATFPKGYNGFYMMKYEVSQGQYRDFLNTLTRAQQHLFAAWLAPGTTSVPTGRYMLSGGSTPRERNGIRCDATIPAYDPMTFHCDLNDNGTPEEADDGECIPVNWIATYQWVGYADWAALRPMSELEYEKAARGPMYPYPHDYAWGTDVIGYTAYTLSGSRTVSEGIATNYSTTLGNALWSNTLGSIAGPVRCGIFAANASNTCKATSGGSYYGIMELSGNLWEFVVSVGHIRGRDFIGSHGDGILPADSSSYGNSDWPRFDGTENGMGVRGGAWCYSNTYNCVSDRVWGSHNYGGRDSGQGIRLVRTEGS